MGTRNDDISLKLAKAVKQGFLPDVSDSEVDILTAEAKKLFSSDIATGENFALNVGQKVMITGDSIDVGGDTSTYRRESWLGNTAAKVNYKINYQINVGLGGRNTANTLAALPADIEANTPNIVIIGGGVTNDHGGGVPEVTTKANLLETIRIVKSYGAIPVFRTTPPCDQAGAGVFNTVALRRNAIQKINAWIHRIADLQGIYVFDLYRQWVDPTTGGYKAGYTADNIHPTPAALSAASDYFAANIPNWLFRHNAQLAQNANDGANLFNGLFYDFAGWGAPAGTGVRSAVSGDTNIIGNWMRLAISDANQSSMYGPSVAVNAGDRLLFSGRYRKDINTKMNIRLVDQAYSTLVTPVADSTVLINTAGGYTFELDFVARAGTTAVRAQILAETAAGNVDVAQLSLINLTALGL